MDDQLESMRPQCRVHGEPRVDQALTQVRQALSGLQYGQIVIMVQDGVVIQIERIERVRISRGAR